MAPVLRPIRPADVTAAANLWVRARRAAHPAIPLPVHPDDEARAHFADVIVPTSDVRLAVEGDQVVGVLALRGRELDHLYLAPEHTGRGTGSALVRLAQQLQPDGLELWTFQSNTRARAFYARHGFVEVEATDGAGNEERAPDVRMVWPGSRPPEPYDVVAVNLDPQADNRIHADDVAQQLGFAGALVPGVEVFALASAPLVAAWGEAFLAGGRLSLRFRKPIYDGERVTVTLDDDALTVAGPDGVLRATGSASATAPRPEIGAYDEVPLPAALAAEPEPGSFGTVVEPADAVACAEYVRRIGEPSPLYDDLVHPGLLLRLVNAALMRNVALGPWIHTASDCRFLGLARHGQQLAVRSRVTDCYARKGHDYVRYDALVLADGLPVAQVAHEAIWRLGL